MGAPICYINPPPPTAEPIAPDLPAIPVATDLQSAIQAVNTMAQIIRTMTNQIGPGQRITDLTVNKKSQFTELKARRQTKTVKVKDPNDSSTFVTVKQITGLTFTNPVTKQTITWNQ